MEPEKHQAQTDRRLDKIEKKLFDGTHAENYKSQSARDKSDNPKSTESHKGEKSNESKVQELKSHLENFRENFNKGELKEFLDIKSKLVNALKSN